MSCYECASRLPETAKEAGVEECPLYSLMCDVFTPSDEGDALIIANAIGKVSLIVKCAHEIPRVAGSNEIVDKNHDDYLKSEVSF